MKADFHIHPNSVQFPCFIIFHVRELIIILFLLAHIYKCFIFSFFIQIFSDTRFFHSRFFSFFPPFVSQRIEFANIYGKRIGANAKKGEESTRRFFTLKD